MPAEVVTIVSAVGVLFIAFAGLLIFADRTWEPKH